MNTTRSEGTLTNLPYALFYAGEFTEARKRAETLNPQPNKAMELHLYRGTQFQLLVRFGRIAEQHGELTSAQQDYAKATPPSAPLPSPARSTGWY